MKEKSVLHIVLRNVAGLIALLGVHYLSDRYTFQQRTGFNQVSPYLFLLSLYVLIVFHNRVLFERYYLGGKKVHYFVIASIMMGLCSLNMYLVLEFFFKIDDKLPRILSFWVYTLAGLGVYVIFKYVNDQERKVIKHARPEVSNPVSYLDFTENGYKEPIPVTDIRYIESLENYVRVITAKKNYIIRMSLKETESLLPKPAFLRISRSHIVNTFFCTDMTPESVMVNEKPLKIGKVYKRYVEEYLTKTAS